MGKIYNDDNKQWEFIEESTIFPILNLSKSYQSNFLEGALEEIASWNNNTQSSILKITSKLNQHQDDIEYLKEHGGGGGSGGGGSTLPTISTSTESTIIIDSDANLELPIFFSSPNLGDGLAYILFDDVEVDTITVSQGNNVLNLGKLSNLKTKVSIYVKDRANLTSNQLIWNIISGGIELTLDFDYNSDYMIGDEIYMDYYISSATSNPIELQLNIDGENYTQKCDQGFNSYSLTDLSVGVHVIKLYATDGTYSSKTYEFNIVILNSESLYLSTTFKGGEYLYGSPIMINYRISDGSIRKFDVKLYLDDNLFKTLSSSRGSYYWTINDASIGNHTYKIEVSCDDDFISIEGDFLVVEGDYTPLSINTQGLVFRLDPTTKTNQDTNRDCPSYDGTTINLYGFNFSSNGWIDGELVCNGGAYAVIDYSPWSDNAKNGSTIEVYFKSTDIGKELTKIIDYSDINTNKGFSIGLDECSMRSISKTATSFVNPDKYIKVSFVIDRRNKFAHIYINGVCSRSFQLSDSGSGVDTVYEDFSHDGKIYINCDKLIENIGCCNIKDILIYRRALSRDEILKNTIAYEMDLSVQKINYNFEFNNTTLSVIKMYGDTSSMTLENACTMRIKYISANTEKYGQSFDLPYCLVNWQGTSSIGYVIKNYQARLRDANMNPYYYSPYPDGIEEWIFCFKADYMESSHGRNVGIARFLNDCIFNIKNPAQLKDSRVRNAINGFPCLMYINDELIGVYNFNTDRYSNNTYGYTDEEKILVYEISANSDTTAGAFYKWTPESGKTEIDYYKADFNCLYPPTRAAGNDSYSEIKRVVEWVHNSSDEDFKDNIEQYFNKKYLLRYYIYVNIFASVDSLGKNMKLASWDGGNTWYLQPYDCDTSIGLDNTGFLRFSSDIEIGDKDTFNTTSSVLWQKVSRIFEADIRSEYALLRASTLKLENLYKYIIEDQIDKIPKYYYNNDMQNKYLNFGSTYLYALHGDGKTFIEQWLKDRLLYIDTLFGYTPSISDFVVLRANKLGDVYLDVQTFTSMYFTIKWSNKDGDTQTLRVGKGETVRFTYTMTTSTDQEVIIYGGQYIKSLGDLSNLQPATLTLAKAYKITELICHSPSLYNTDISDCINLTKVDLSDCSQLGGGVSGQPILKVGNCNNLEYLNCQNTLITEVQLNPKGSNIKELLLSKSTENISLNNCPNLDSLNIEEGHNCKKIEIIDCPNLKFGNNSAKDLSGIIELTLNNSCNNLNEIIIQDTSKLKTINIYNCPSIKGIRLGLEIFESLPTFSLESAKTGKDVTIKTINSNNLKDLTITGYGRNSSLDFSLPNRPENSIVTRNQYDTFISNNFDISNTQIENINIFATTLINNFIVPNTFKSLRCNSMYETNRTPYNGLEGSYPSCIFNIYNPHDEYIHDSDNKIWNLEGLNLKDFDILNLNNDDNCLIEIKNINISCTNYPVSFNCHKKSISPEGQIDYTNYIGTSLEYAFSYSDSDKLNIILPEYFQNVEDISNAFYYCRQNWNWKDIIDIINKSPNLKIIGDNSFSYATLNNSNDVIFKSENEIKIGSDIFKGSNLTNILEFNYINGTQIYDETYSNSTFSNTNLEYIGNITLKNGRLKHLFYRSSNLKSIGDINITNLLQKSAESMCAYCSALESIGNVNTSTIEIFRGSFRQTSLQNLEIDVRKAVNIDYTFYGCESLSNVVLNNLDINTTLNSANYTFSENLKLQSVSGADYFPSSITSALSTYRLCKNLTSAPLLPPQLDSYLNADYMCYTTSISSIGNLPEKLNSADCMFTKCPIIDDNIILPSTLSSAISMINYACATNLNVFIPANCTKINGILDNITSETLTLTMEDPTGKRSLTQFIGANNPNLTSVYNVNLYNSSGFEYLYCRNLNTITFTNNSEIKDSLNVVSTSLNLETIETIINILWDATGWEEYETITNPDGSTEQKLKVKTLLLGERNMTTLKNSSRAEEILSIGINKNWTITG